MRGNAAVARRYDRASRRHVLGVVPFGRFPPGRPPSVQCPLLALETSGAVNMVGAMCNLEGEVADPTDAVRWILAHSQVFMDTMVAGFTEGPMGVAQPCPLGVPANGAHPGLVVPSAHRILRFHVGLR